MPLEVSVGWPPVTLISRALKCKGQPGNSALPVAATTMATNINQVRMGISASLPVAVRVISSGAGRILNQKRRRGLYEPAATFLNLSSPEPSFIDDG